MKLLFIIPIEILVVALPFFFTGLGWMLNKIFNKKEKADTDKIKAEITQMVINQMQQLNEEYRQEIAELRLDNERCELEHQKTMLELQEMKKQMNYQAKLKGKVFILDDDFDDLHDFESEFKKISIIDYRGFHDHEEFIESARSERPSIVVMDHRLGNGTTAQDVIGELGYEPEILIMSGVQAFEKIYEGKRIKFFVKEGQYVMRIAGEVIKYLTAKK